MRKTLAVALVALAGACSSEKTKTIQWEAPRAANTDEGAAISSASLTLQSSLAYQPSTEPSAGAAGLGDQLAAELASAAAVAPGAPSAKIGQDVVRQAIGTGTLDPACVVPTPVTGGTRYDWNCVVDDTSTDPYTGETTTMHVTVVGSLTWKPATRQTSWSFDTNVAMTQVSGQDTITMGSVGKLGGDLAVTDTRITANTTSTAHVTETMQGPSGNLSVEGDLSTTLTAGLDYVADPFCITGGELEVVQNTRAYTVTQTDAWKITWTGCGLFQIQHGS